MRALRHGRAKRVPKRIRRVCVVQTAKMGDMVCTTPMFRAIKKKYPDAEVFVVGDAINAGIVKHNPDVAGYVLWRNDYQAVAKELKVLTIGYACLTTPNALALAALYLSGIPAIAAPQVFGGWSPFETRAYKRIRALVISKSHTMGQYAPREYLRLLEPIGIYTDDTTKHLAYSPEAKEEVGFFLKEHNLTTKPFAVISPSAGNKIKNWPAERFARVAEYLADKGMPVVIIGGPRDTEEVEEMMQALAGPHPLVINTLGQFTIDSLKALIARAALFISVDTGPLYIAEAFGVPTVDIVGPIDENEQPPIGSWHRVVVPQRARPELFVLNAHIHNKEEVKRQTQSISTEQVIAEIDSLLASLKQPL